MRSFSLVLLCLLLFAGALAALTHPLPGWTAREPVGERKTFTRLANKADEAAGAQDASIVWYELGSGAPVVMLPSLGREASDFNELAEALADAGFKAVMVQPPGVDGAAASRQAPDLFDLADDLEPVLRAQGEPVIMLGHAFGNRLARAAATAHPDHVSGVALVAAGGRRPIEARAEGALRNAFNPVMTAAKRKEEVRYAFFAQGNKMPDYWLRGWHRRTARLQSAATQKTAVESWWAGGERPMLVVAGMQDTIAPPQDTVDLLEEEFADRVEAVRIDRAGHALLPERPEEIADAVIGFVKRLNAPDEAA